MFAVLMGSMMVPTAALRSPKTIRTFTVHRFVLIHAHSLLSLPLLSPNSLYDMAEVGFQDWTQAMRPQDCSLEH